MRKPQTGVMPTAQSFCHKIIHSLRDGPNGQGSTQNNREHCENSLFECSAYVAPAQCSELFKKSFEYEEKTIEKDVSDKDESNYLNLNPLKLYLTGRIFNLTSSSGYLILTSYFEET